MESHQIAVKLKGHMRKLRARVLAELSALAHCPARMLHHASANLSAALGFELVFVALVPGMSADKTSTGLLNYRRCYRRDRETGYGNLHFLSAAMKPSIAKVVRLSNHARGAWASPAKKGERPCRGPGSRRLEPRHLER